jgi:hypothetical protein
LLGGHGSADKGTRAKPSDQGVFCPLTLLYVGNCLRRARGKALGAYVVVGRQSFPFLLRDADLTSGYRYEASALPDEEKRNARYAQSLRGSSSDCDGDAVLLEG